MVKAIFAVLGGFCVYVMGTLSYVGIALLMGIESACIPLPSELIMPYAGAMTEPSIAAELSSQFGIELPVFNLFIAAVAGALGCNLGSEVAYWVGAKGGRPAIERYGKYLLISKSTSPTDGLRRGANGSCFSHAFSRSSGRSSHFRRAFRG